MSSAVYVRASFIIGIKNNHNNNKNNSNNEKVPGRNRRSGGTGFSQHRSYAHIRPASLLREHRNIFFNFFFIYNPYIRDIYIYIYACSHRVYHERMTIIVHVWSVLECHTIATNHSTALFSPRAPAARGANSTWPRSRPGGQLYYISRTLSYTLPNRLDALCYSFFLP